MIINLIGKFYAVGLFGVWGNYTKDGVKYCTFIYGIPSLISAFYSFYYSSNFKKIVKDVEIYNIQYDEDEVDEISFLMKKEPKYS